VTYLVSLGIIFIEGFLPIVTKGEKEMEKSFYSEKRFSNYREIINHSAKAFKDKTAFLIKKGEKSYRRVSYSELRDSYYRLSLYLLGRGLEGRRIVVVGKNSYAWTLSYLAAATVGVAVPVDKELSLTDIDNFIEASHAALVLADDEMASKLSDKCQVVYFSELTEICADRTPLDYKRIDDIEIPRDKMQILIFTSGTTGSSKGVCLSQYNVCSNIFQTVSIVKIKKSDTTLSLLPLHHTYECTLDCLLLLSRGCTITYAESLQKVSKNLVEYSPSVLVVVPEILKFLNRRIKAAIAKSLPSKYATLFEEKTIAEALRLIPAPLAFIIKRKVKKSLGGKIRLFIVGAADLDTALVDDFSSLGIRTLQGYGLTECAPLLAGNSDFFYNPKSTGRAIPGVELKIHEPNEDGVGEILAKGDNVMLGYYNDKAATEAVFLDGWFCTGDLGRMDGDGGLYITGRRKNVIVTENGKNIYPEELETRLYAFASIADVIVMADKQDGKTQVKAKIFPNHEFLKSTFGRIPSPDEIKELIAEVVKKVNAAIPSYKHIRVFEVLTEALEKTTTRKIKRFGNNLT